MNHSFCCQAPHCMDTGVPTSSNGNTFNLYLGQLAYCYETDFLVKTSSFGIMASLEVNEEIESIRNMFYFSDIPRICITPRCNDCDFI